VTTTKRSSFEFSGSRLRVARTFYGLTLAELGERIAVTRQFVYQLESGARQPSDQLLNAAADALGVAPEFFFEPLKDEFREEECNFRRRRGTPLSARHQAVSHGTLFGMVVSYMDEALSLPGDGLPKIHVQDVERLAEGCRVHWGLGVDRPIASMTRLLENAGVVVSSFEGSSDKVDAFSRAGRRNVAVLSSLKGSACRSRFDLAHELGHLVMHTGMEPPESAAAEVAREREADRFAGAFLLPRIGFAREFPRQAVQGRLRWSDLLEMKGRWRVSLGAIMHRAHDLSFIDAAAYRRAMISLRSNKWHKKEPLDEVIEGEPPEIIPLAFTQLEKSYGLTAVDVAKQLHLKPAMFEKVVGVPMPTPVVDDKRPDAEIHRLDHYRRKAGK
jgi:Zn-dependent peptidase ImmA (M78 family)/transcriptional regulator with XRE-family HTH domain